MPKRGMSAFIFFSNHRRPLIKLDNPSLTFGELAKEVSKDFRALTEDDMKKWQAKAVKDKARYVEQMKSYVPPSPSEDSDSDSDAPRKKKPKKKKKDPNAPKKGMSAFMLFSIATRPTLKAENPSASFGDLAKLVGKSFKSLSEKELKKWQDKAAIDKKRYEKQMANYQKAPSSESEQSEEEAVESSAASSSEEGSGSDSGSGDSSDESDSESD